IDTSGKSGGVTLAEGDAHSFRVLGSSAISGGTFSAQLVPTVAALLEERKLTVHDVNGLCVASGPGSFTGLRVGLSAVKGLAEVLHIPIAAVSLLAALASRSHAKGTVLAALDAGRGEFFVGTYFKDADTNSQRCVDESLRTRAELLAQIQASPSPALITCDESVAQAASETGISLETVSRPDSALIAQLGLERLLAGDTVAIEALDANYLRRSDAEIFFKGTR
ncbi:MAG TPA: tRNA (adenosine(37)-N6)-threonylcarbamoyltransferase complex dimerization subunit type 1 TsaB, partial [Candidatus Limnocylindrales bacterium]|nr:tRNA (adenosine(37)-N6)-threonylcarbamoyltransferase complex dimerization subunit type 1 TsaB [Candidatus Limnocylindrales bacterium]